jgi:hypothetical protein
MKDGRKTWAGAAYAPLLCLQWRTEDVLTFRGKQEPTMQIRRWYLCAFFVAIIAIVAPQLSTPRLPGQQPGPAAPKKRCVGISTSLLRSQNPVITRVYRVFDDGSVETYDDGAPGAKWSALGM